MEENSGSVLVCLRVCVVSMPQNNLSKTIFAGKSFGVLFVLLLLLLNMLIPKVRTLTLAKQALLSLI